MVSRSIIVLAASLPLAVWLQGCKDKKDKPKDPKDPKDPKKPNDQTQPSHQEPEKPKTPENLTHGWLTNYGNKNQLAKDALKASDVTFVTRDGLYKADESVVTTTVVTVEDPSVSNFAGPLQGANGAWGYNMLLQEYKIETTNNMWGQWGGVINPGVLSGQVMKMQTMGAPGVPFLMNAKSVVPTATASAVIAVGVPAPGEFLQPQYGINGFQMPQQYHIVVELYYNIQNKHNFPRGNPNHLATAFMPFYDNLEYFHTMCRKTFFTVLFANHALVVSPTPESNQMFRDLQAVDRKDAFGVVSENNAWYHYNDARVAAGRVAGDLTISFNIGAKQPSHPYKNNKTIKDVTKAIDRFVSDLRNMIALLVNTEGHLLPLGAPAAGNNKVGGFPDRTTGVWEPWSLSNEFHYELFAEHILARDVSMQNRLQDIKIQLDWMYAGHENWVTFDSATLAAGAVCPNTHHSPKHRQLRYNAGAAPLALVAQNVIADRSIHDPATGVSNRRLCLAKWWWTRLMTHSQKMVPAEGQQWSDFTPTAAYNSGSYINEPFLTPKIQEVNALESYLPTKLSVIHPGSGVSDDFAEVMVWAFYSAFKYSKSNMANGFLTEMATEYVLGDASIQNGSNMFNNNGQRNLVKRGIQFKPQNCFKTLEFVTLQQHVDSDNKSFEDLVRAIAEVEVELKVVEAAVKQHVEKIQPTSTQDSRYQNPLRMAAN